MPLESIKNLLKGKTGNLWTNLKSKSYIIIYMMKKRKRANYPLIVLLSHLWTCELPHCAAWCRKLPISGIQLTGFTWALRFLSNTDGASLILSELLNLKLLNPSHMRNRRVQTPPVPPKAWALTPLQVCHVWWDVKTLEVRLLLVKKREVVMTSQNQYPAIRSSQESRGWRRSGWWKQRSQKYTFPLWDDPACN